jgi:hypothetical protein
LWETVLTLRGFSSVATLWPKAQCFTLIFGWLIGSAGGRVGKFATPPPHLPLDFPSPLACCTYLLVIRPGGSSYHRDAAVRSLEPGSTIVGTGLTTITWSICNQHRCQLRGHTWVTEADMSVKWWREFRQGMDNIFLRATYYVGKESCATQGRIQNRIWKSEKGKIEGRRLRSRIRLFDYHISIKLLTKSE